MNKLITLTTATYSHEIYVLKTLLESNKIQCFIKDNINSQVIGTSIAVGGVKLLINEVDKEKALKILKEYKK